MKLLREDYMEMSRLLRIKTQIEDKMGLLSEYSKLSPAARDKHKDRIKALEKEMDALSKEFDRLKQ
jgi:predicted nuclease with TOPRIM domain